MDRYEIIWRSIQKNGYKYDYREVNTTVFGNNENLQTVICPIHGRFKIKMSLHIRRGTGCQKCNGRKISHDDRKKLIIDKFGEEVYEFRESDFSSITKKTIVYCKKCGNKIIASFDEIYNNWKHPCVKCFKKEQSEKQKVDIEIIKQRIENVINKDLDDEYNLDNYVDTKSKINLHCIKHGWYKTYFKDFVNKGVRCSKCAHEISSEKRKLKWDVFKERANKIYGNDFTYFKDTFIQSSDNITIQCNKCGSIFERKVYYHLGSYVKCKYCSKQSLLEKEIQDYLRDKNVEFTKEQVFEWLKYKDYLKLDFYLPKYNIGIECQGIQHFEQIDFFGDTNKFELCSFRDRLKLELCNLHNIKLYYFSKENYDFFLGEKVYHTTDELFKEIENV